MKNTRDMFYSNYQAGGMSDPNIIYTPPSGYNINAQYQAYGPNVMSNQSNIPYTNTNEYDERITKLERQIRRLDERIRKLENNTLEENITDSNLYMI